MRLNRKNGTEMKNSERFNEQITNAEMLEINNEIMIDRM